MSAQKPVKATDPRKPQLLKALKTASGGSKITNVKELGNGTFQGTCFKHIEGSRKFENLGVFQVEFEGVDDNG